MYMVTRELTLYIPITTVSSGEEADKYKYMEQALNEREEFSSSLLKGSYCED